MSVLVASLVVHIISLVFLYLLVVPAAAHRLANVTYPRHIPAFAAAIHSQSGTEHGLTHSHTHSITVVIGVVLSLVFLCPARALRRAVCASLYSMSGPHFEILGGTILADSLLILPLQVSDADSQRDDVLLLGYWTGRLKPE
ncbi:hypothetical protein C8R43DRAFT_1139836 [Mycena crocata]|nr:hypothetical protein C8R43DRAFT_1139836 [Mycena crocata]